MKNLVSIFAGHDASVSFWNAKTNKICELYNSADNNQEDEFLYPSALKWIQNGNCLAVGLSNGEVQLWDTHKQAQIRSIKAHNARVSSMSWNKFILTTGGRDS